MKLELSRQIFEKSSNIKFHENTSSGNRVVPCGRTDMTKLTVAFRNYANVPKMANRSSFPYPCYKGNLNVKASSTSVMDGK